ncbi:MAG TPA: lysine 5,6-aminomutase subunit alpha [Bacillota bacterium]|nr:lysine 5,6-aminomutase subunit alpha [Bacillota bacterium]HOL12387.1 lysine 5,6-aminomutase subunit alpha [Bacillota bacterium]HPP61040.1 lysine 5,6-aminomutase subunit alpha [Bacillota bacterium]HQD74896.1 lysine 5,6-aminomutase subunit alpha [Bacillota bacterium]
MLKLNLDEEKITQCHQLAKNITSKVNRDLLSYSTVSIERTVARFSGVNGVDEEGVPFPNILVNQIVDKGKISDGAALYLGNACIELNATPQEVSHMVAKGELDVTNLPWHGAEAAQAKARELCQESLDLIKTNRKKRESLLRDMPVTETPWLYVICATGNALEDAVQARMAASQGADVIAVIRSTGQSLLDYVPYGITTEGFGGTYATQENFKLMRKALDEESEKLGRYIRLVNYCSGLCMPEIAYMGAVERLDMMLNDAMYGILFRDINMERTLVDQNFSRMINAYAGIIINTGEDNYLTTADAFHAGPSVLASQFMNYHFAKNAGLGDELIGLGHAFEIDPFIEDSISYELAMALLVRQIFPDCPIKYMPPTVHKKGDIFFSHVLDASFNLVSTMTGQTIHLVGMLTEAIHTPLIQDRYLSISAARYARSAAKNLGKNLEIAPDSLVQDRASSILDDTLKFLEYVDQKGLFGAIGEGAFAGIKRHRSGGRGREGVFKRSPSYFNPVEDLLRQELF